jgi:hypothetical protein
VKKITIGSGVRYDLALASPAYIEELVRHHVGGYLKVAPEHTEAGPLAKMCKPGIASFDEFRVLFERFSRQAGKQQYLIPYFHRRAPGHHLAGHGGARALVQTQRLPTRPGAGLSAHAHGHRHRHVSHRPKPLAALAPPRR